VRVILSAIGRILEALEVEMSDQIIFLDAAPSDDEKGNLAPMDMLIAVGFGLAQITKGTRVIFEEQDDPENYHYLSEFEAMAQRDPEHDWRCTLQAPLNGREYQRQGRKKWVLIEVNPGFA
jgi:hypothetical protein